MFCPKCAEAQTIESTQYCTKCGFKLENLNSFLENGGDLNLQNSSRQKGIRQGSKLILLSIILFPIYVFIAPLFPPNDFLVESSPSNALFEQISWAIMTTLFVAGLVRISYSFIFENNFRQKNVNSTNTAENTQKSFSSAEKQNFLPPAQGTPISDFRRWKQTTGELFEPILRKRKTSGELK